MNYIKKILFKELKELFRTNEVMPYFKYEIAKVEEYFSEFCLTLRFDNFEINGIYAKKKQKLMENQIIHSCQLYLEKSNDEIKIYIRHLVLKEKEEENIKQMQNSKIKTIYNFKPEFLQISLNNLEIFEEYLSGENVFIYFNLFNNIVTLYDPIAFDYYSMDYKNIKNILNLNKNDFIYLKFHSINKNKITCNNLTFIQKANEYQIFNILDKKIVNKYLLDFYEIKTIKENEEIKLAYIFTKIILKSFNDQYILIVDKFNRIIKLTYNQIPDLDLFDLLIIINCKIKKDQNNKFYYILILTDKSLYYKSKTLVFNKEISINNYSLLNINIPDYKEKNNYYNQIIISDFKEIDIKSNQQIYLFKFNNDLYNEIIPFNIKIKNKTEKINFKFFIVNNLINNINIFINYANNDKCSIEYCYYNYFDKVPYIHKMELNKKTYEITHYNSFDNCNIIGFILINVPSDKNTNKIKKRTNKKIISSQIWYTASKDKNIINYNTTQILNVDEAKPRVYFKYNLKLKKYSKFENFYFNMVNFVKQRPSSKYEAYKYFETINKEYEIIDRNEFESIIDNNNVDFIPESADFYTFKIFTSLLLIDSLNKIKNNNNNNLQDLCDSCNEFLENYIKLIDQLNDLGKLLTYHQKIRILDSYNYDIFKTENPYKYLSRFLYIDIQSLNNNNSYLLAFKFNIDIIKNLNEKSALTRGYRQLDGYILQNYFINDDKVRADKTYSLLNEPISLMKYHLLINYENFIIINYKNKYDNIKVKAMQDCSNRITFINEKILFNSYNTETLKGKDNALPISVEFFHENSHSKKNSKNCNTKSSLSCFKNNQTILLDKREDGKFIESFIGDIQIINNLKNPDYKLGELMQLEYFIDEDFHKLHEKYKELISLKNPDIKMISHNKNIESDPLNNGNKNEIKIFQKNEDKLKTLEDFENFYLINKSFIYPDSLPFHEYPLGEEKREITKAEKEYLDKYKNEFQSLKKEDSNIKKKICF